MVFRGVCSLKSLGKVVSISEGKLVLKTDAMIKVGGKVFDEQGIQIGTIVDYFGPVGGPYVLVSPKKTPEPYVGRELFGSGGKK